MDTEFIVDSHCKEQATIQILINFVKDDIMNLLKSSNINTLKYFVVSDDNENNYKQTVFYYGSILGDESYVTTGEYTGYGKTIDGYTINGEYIQVIVIKASVLWYYYCDLCYLYKTNLESLPSIYQKDYMGIKLVYHEIGHTWNNQDLFKNNLIDDNKSIYNLHYELDEYLLHKSKNLCCEYYAEFFMYSVLKTLDITFNINDAEATVLQCICSFNKTNNIVSVAERVNLIIYYHFHCLAYYHSIKEYNNTYIYYEDHDESKEYIPYFKDLETELIKLNSKYPIALEKNELKQMAKILKELVQLNELK